MKTDHADFLIDHPIIYVARDIERTLGFDLPQKGYFIISNETAAAQDIQNGHDDSIFLVREEDENGDLVLLDTHELLELPSTKQLIDSMTKTSPRASVLVFKNTARIEETCKQNGWTLLNPSAALSQKVEEKISQVEWLGPLAKYLPPHEILACKDLKATEASYIVQFNHGYSGGGTILIHNEADLAPLKQKFPNRLVRKTTFIDGPVFTSNNIVTPDTTLVGNISYQITGLAPFTDGKFTTVGNDWALPHTLMSEDHKKQYHEMVTAIGDHLRASGWKGLFGVDALISKKTGHLHLLEINARQPASAPFESELQRATAIVTGKISSETVFSAHVKSLLDLPVSRDVVEIKDGGQIVQRITGAISKNFIENTDPAAALLLKSNLEQITVVLGLQGFHTVLYDNKSPNSELLRVQSTAGLLASESAPNENGELITALLSSLSL